jgi:hypothetical protein
MMGDGEMIKKMEYEHYLIMAINILGISKMINIVEMELFVERMVKYMNVNLKMENQMD